MKVCIAEKPSVAKEIAMVIGAKQRRDGYYEGNGYQVTWTFGHLCTLKEPQDYDPALKRWDLTTLPIIPVKFAIKIMEDKGVKQQFNVIKSLVAKAQEVINCGDAGQEGELIQRWVLQEARCRVPVKRLWISSLTEEAIRDGFRALRDAKEFDLLYAAGSSRAIGDWLLGINATRLYTLKYGAFGQVLSIGRVQTPTLALIVNRQKELNNFTPETYWELKTKYRDVLFTARGEQLDEFGAFEGKFKDKEKAEELVRSLENQPFTITSFTKKKGKETPPKLFDLTSLQVTCNKKFGFSADQTLKLAQSLYEKKVLTYPRVDTTHLPNDVFPQVPAILKTLHKFADQVQPLLGKPIKKSKKVFDDKKVTDHHAIIPTKVAAKGLAHNEQVVYDLVALRFIAAFYPDCIVSKTEVLGDVKGIEFKVTGKQILDPGWRVLFQKEEEAAKRAREQRKKRGEEDDDDDNKGQEDQEQVLPEFKKGESGPHEPQLQEKVTSPPKLYTEATLLRAMETAGKQVEDEELRDLMKENGIGRPSTRAAIIETLFRRKYIRKERKNLVPTQTGTELVDTIQNEMLKSAELTGVWEKKLREIEDGTYQVANFMNEMKEMVTEVVQTVKYDQNAKRIVTEDPEEKPEHKTAATADKKKKAVSDKKITCPKCGEHEVVKGNTAYGCLGNKDKSCDFVIGFEFGGKKLTDKQLQSLIIKGKTPSIKGLEIDGQKVEGYLTLDKRFKVAFHKVEEALLTCPKCKKYEVVKGKTAFGCLGNKYRTCNFVVPFEIRGKKLSENQIKQLVQKGKTGKLSGFEVNGDKFNAKLILDANCTIQFEKMD
ncbi:DNA topoisomerase 3 [Limibacter armeniacum]|uniref:type IA DNA topoisomerase n=1 Tax=Limibacter armeniacum TaxID=466084 RepID=UPI002FE5C7D3